MYLRVLRQWAVFRGEQNAPPHAHGLSPVCLPQHTRPWPHPHQLPGLPRHISLLPVLPHLLNTPPIQSQVPTLLTLPQPSTAASAGACLSFPSFSRPKQCLL